MALAAARKYASHVLLMPDATLKAIGSGWVNIYNPVTMKFIVALNTRTNETVGQARISNRFEIETGWRARSITFEGDLCIVRGYYAGIVRKYRGNKLITVRPK